MNSKSISTRTIWMSELIVRASITFCFCWITANVSGQCYPTSGSACSATIPMCASNNPNSSIEYCNNTGIPPFTGNLNCLGSAPNPTFLYFQVQNSGNISFNIVQTNLAGGPIDVDFIVWGPFNSPNSCNGLGNNDVDCSYSAASVENVFIPNAQAGQYYLLLVTNFSGQAGTIVFNQPSGSGSTDCGEVDIVVDATSSNASCNGSSNGSIAVEVYGIGPYHIELVDAAGTIINSINTSNNTASFTGLPAGSYTVNASSQSSLPISPGSDAVVISQPLAPVADISYSSNLCVGSGNVPVINSGTFGGSYSVTPAGLTVGNNGSLHLNNSLPGTYQVHYTVGPASCQVSTSVFLTVQDAPVNIQLTPGNICAGTAFTGTAATATQYEYFLNGTSLGSPSTSSNFTSPIINQSDQFCVRGYDVPVMTMDGTFSESYYGNAIAQGNSSLTSGFGTGNHMDALYMAQQGDNMYMGIAGALEDNPSPNRILIFLDTQAGGFNDLTTWNNAAYALFSLNGIENNIQFDPGFTADFVIVLNRSSGGTYLDVYEMDVTGTNVGAIFSLSAPSANFAYSAAVGSFDTNHGFEWNLPLSIVGNPAGEIGVFSMMVNSVSNASTPVLISNQFLTPASNGEGNYGTGPIDFGSAVPDPIHYIVGGYNCYDDDCLTIDIPSTVAPPAVAPLCQNTTVIPNLPTTISGIQGTWNPAVIDVSSPVTGAIYTFTPDPTECATAATLAVDVITPTSLTSSLPISFCQGAAAPALPTSLNSINGTWSPGSIATNQAATVTPINYVFTPNANACALPYTHTVSVTPSQTPTFSLTTTICQNATPPVLPLVSNEGMNGVWSNAISTATIAQPTSTFTPDLSNPAFQCPVPVTITFDITNGTPATFLPQGPYCATDSPVLPTTSTQGFTGTWSPASINMANTNPLGSTYTFTPDPNQCGSNGSITIVINAPLTPTFPAIPALCLNATAPNLNLTSNNGVAGTWNPATIATNSAVTSAYNFTPSANQCASPISMNVTVNSPTTPTFNLTGTYCQGSTAQALPLTSTNAISGTWSPNSIATGTSGPFSYTFTPAANQCASVLNLPVTIDPLINPSFTNVGPLCLNTGNVPLPLTSAEGVSGTWNVPNASTAALGNTTYTFTPSAGLCASTASMLVAVQNAVAPTFTDIGTICETISPLPILPTSSNNGFTGIWSPSTVDVSVLGNTNYSFTPDPGQCASNGAMTINVLDEATPAFTFNSVYCLGDVADVLPLISDNTISGTWAPSVIQTSTATLIPDDYIFTPAASECASNATVSVQVNSPQASNFNTLPTTFCQNEAVGMLPSLSDEGFSGSWNPTSIVTNSPANFPLTFTPTAGQCAAPFNTNITVQPLQPTVFSGLTAQVCQDPTAVVNFTATDDNGITGSWFPAALLANNVGNFNAVFTPSAGQCNEVFNWTVQVLDLPQVTFTSSPIAISCNEPDLDITAAGGVSYVWENGLGNNSVLTVNGGADYSVDVTDINGCTSTGTFTVPYDTVTTCYIDAITTTLNCSVLDIDLNVVGGVSYLWANGLGTSATLNVTNPGLYAVNVMHANGCDRNINITVDQDLNPPVVVIDNVTAEDTLTCATTQINLMASGAVSYQWDNGLPSTASVSIQSPGSYTVTGTGANFCTSTAAYDIEQDITLPIPTLLASDDTLDCFVDSIQLDAGGGVLYQWDHGPIDHLIYVHEPGVYEVTVYGANGCSDAINWNIGWNRFLPDSNFVFSPTQVMDENPTIQLESQNINGVTYLWSVDGNEFYTGPECSYTFASFQPGTYQVCLKAYVSDICQSDTCHDVNVKESLQLFIPTSFTPGGDGINDGFYPVFSNQDLIKYYELNIFNRWGDVIFTTQNPEEFWDGGYRIDGQYFIQDGIYPYILTYQTRYDVEYRKVKGTITISR